MRARDEQNQTGSWSNVEDVVVSQGFLRGDADGDGKITTGDIIYLINYLYLGGSAPTPFEAGDANSDGEIDIGDIIYLVNYLFLGGAPPEK